MSSYSHKGYAQRSRGYSRRRHKAASFKRKRNNTILRVLAAVLILAAAAALAYVGVKYIYPYVSQRIAAVRDEDSTSSAVETYDTPAGGSFDTVDSDVYVYNGSAYLMFDGVDSTAGSYAAVINSVISSVDDDIDVYNMVIPTAAEFGLDENGRQYTYSQRENLNKISSLLRNTVINVDVYDTLSEHQDEYIYFRTENCVTALGAYYAFAEFRDAAKLSEETYFTLAELSTRRGIINSFGGSLLQRTVDESTQPNGNESLYENRDTIEFYKIDADYTCYIQDDNGEETETELFSLDGVESDPFGIFPSGSLIRIENNEGTGTDKLLIIKDDFANPMIGYFVSGYGEVHVIDTQTYHGNAISYISENDITQVVFICGIENANNSLYCQRLRDLFDSSTIG